VEQAKRGTAMPSYDENASSARHGFLQENSVVKGWMDSIRHLTLA
jgi:hypothetical protein